MRGGGPVVPGGTAAAGRVGATVRDVQEGARAQVHQVRPLRDASLLPPPRPHPQPTPRQGRAGERIHVAPLPTSVLSHFRLADYRYHQKVPDEIPPLEEDAKYGWGPLVFWESGWELESGCLAGLVAAIEFQMPPPDGQWAPHVYQAFDITKASMPDFNVCAAPDLSPLR